VRAAFGRFAHWTSDALGTPLAFVLALVVVAVWGLSGPLFRFSDTWQLVINTGTTVVTFLIVFVIQGAQNRNDRALHLKLDAIVAALEGVSNRLVAAEELPEEALSRERDLLLERVEEAEGSRTRRAARPAQPARGGRLSRGPRRR
jgi:low affinity Fe/Cu permease